MSELNNASGLREMPTEQLDKMLQAELDRENPDPISVRMLLEILEEREKEHPIAMNERQKKALAIYQSRVEKNQNNFQSFFYRQSHLRGYSLH